MDKKTFFFDMDGVLVISEHLHFEAWEKQINEKKIYV